MQSKPILTYHYSRPNQGMPEPVVVIPRATMIYRAHKLWDSLDDEGKQNLLSTNLTNLLDFCNSKLGMNPLGREVERAIAFFNANGSWRRWPCHFCRAILLTEESHTDHLRFMHVFGSLVPSTIVNEEDETRIRDSLDFNAETGYLSLDPAVFGHSGQAVVSYLFGSESPEEEEEDQTAFYPGPDFKLRYAEELRLLQHWERVFSGEESSQEVEVEAEARSSMGTSHAALIKKRLGELELLQLSSDHDKFEYALLIAILTRAPALDLPSVEHVHLSLERTYSLTNQSIAIAFRQTKRTIIREILALEFKIMYGPLERQIPLMSVHDYRAVILPLMRRALREKWKLNISYEIEVELTHNEVSDGSIDSEEYVDRSEEIDSDLEDENS